MTTSLPVLLLAALALPTVASANPLSPIDCDFDGNGYDDLAMSAPGEALGSLMGGGAINVLYGSSQGLRAFNDDIFHQDATSIEGVGEQGDAFGGALACGDFDNDGYDDLAIGVPREDVGSVANAGAVQVIYGSPFGLWPTDDEVWTQDTTGMLDAATSGDQFGTALATGDLDGDGYEDLVIGVPGEDVDGNGNAGAIQILFGGYGGLYATGNAFITENTAGISGVSEWGDLFGGSLAVADFDGDGYDDVAVGSPGESEIGPNPDNGARLGSTRNLTAAGAFHVIYGAASGWTSLGDDYWHQGTSGVIGTTEQYDRMGASLAAGDFDDDGYADLAVGSPGESVGSIAKAGAVNVFYGTASGLTTLGDTNWYQGKIQGGAEARDRLGESLVSADFDGDGYADLAIGTPGESVVSDRGAGAVHVMLGGAGGLAASGNQIFHQDSSGMLYDAEPGDRFGDTLSTGDFDGDGRNDLAIGVPGESVGSTQGVGVMQVMYGVGYGLSAAGNQIWHQGIADVDGAMEAYDRTGGTPMSTGVYRFPYADGTSVFVNNDYWTHQPFGRIDMNGTGGGAGTEYLIVAAAGGWIRALVDSNAEPTDDNNYIWIQHANGEWTKYSHIATDSATDRGRALNQWVSAGTILGVESDVGRASGDHLHFEVAVPNDPANPMTADGFIRGDNRIPQICGVGGNALIGGTTYTADGC